MKITVSARDCEPLLAVTGPAQTTPGPGGRAESTAVPAGF